MRAPMKKGSAIMKKFLLSAAAASMVAIPLMAAAPAEAAPRHKTTGVKHKANGLTVIKPRKVVRRPVQRTVRYQTRSRTAHDASRPGYATQPRTWRPRRRFNYRYAPP